MVRSNVVEKGAGDEGLVEIFVVVAEKQFHLPLYAIPLNKYLISGAYLSGE